MGKSIHIVTVCILIDLGGVEVYYPLGGVPHTVHIVCISGNTNIARVIKAIALEGINTIIWQLEHNGSQPKVIIQIGIKLLGINIKHKFRGSCITYVVLIKQGNTAVIIGNNFNGIAAFCTINNALLVACGCAFIKAAQHKVTSADLRNNNVKILFVNIVK